MDGWGGPPDAGAYPDWRLMSVHAFPSSSILCFFDGVKELHQPTVATTTAIASMVSTWG